MRFWELAQRRPPRRTVKLLGIYATANFPTAPKTSHPRAVLDRDAQESGPESWVWGEAKLQFELDIRLPANIEPLAIQRGKIVAKVDDVPGDRRLRLAVADQGSELLAIGTFHRCRSV
jgi:hypothetical protein